MPFYQKQRNFTPLLIAAEKKAIKNGVHHSIFTSRFDKYIGDWKNDLKEGKGLFQTITGKLYEGDWYRGFRHGFGTLSNRLPNGTFSLEYRGEWVRGKPEGAGWRYYDNGDIYFGFWKKGHRHGYGKMWYADRTFYVGYWNMNKKAGLGMLVQVNGNRYEGHWENDEKNGLGRFYHMHTGQLQEGCWVRDVCVRSKVTDIIIRQFCDLPTQYALPPFGFRVGMGTREAQFALSVLFQKSRDMQQPVFLCFIDYEKAFDRLKHEVELKSSKNVLEDSRLWLEQKIGEIDNNLKYCVDQMY